MKILLLGAPGAGKGTQAALIAAKYKIPHISTGDILRKNIREETPLGKQAKSIIDSGNLVPDDLVIKLVESRLAESDCGNGWMLDGFPRTIPQAVALDEIQHVDLAVEIKIPFDVLLSRITGRRMCECGATYHTDFYKSDICSACGKKLYQRDDDKEATVAKRLENYKTQTEPLIAYYGAQGKLATVDGNRVAQEVFCQVTDILNDYDKK